MATELFATFCTGAQVGADKLAVLSRLNPVTVGFQEIVTVVPARLKASVGCVGVGLLVKGIGIPASVAAPRARTCSAVTVPSRTCRQITQPVFTSLSASASPHMRT